MKWEYISLWDTGSDIEIDVVKLKDGDNSLKYIKYVGPDGFKTITDFEINTTMRKNGFSTSWNISSEEEDIDLQLAIDEDNSKFHQTYYISFGKAEGTINGEPVDGPFYSESLWKKG